MIKYLKPTRLRLLSMVLIWIAIWSADEIENFVIEPLLKRTAPEIWNIVDDAEQKVDSIKENSENEQESLLESKIWQLGAIVYLGEWGSRAFASYLCACIIIGLTERRKSQNKTIERDSR